MSSEFQLIGMESASAAINCWNGVLFLPLNFSPPSSIRSQGSWTRSNENLEIDYPTWLRFVLNSWNGAAMDLHLRPRSYAHMILDWSDRNIYLYFPLRIYILHLDSQIDRESSLSREVCINLHWQISYAPTINQLSNGIFSASIRTASSKNHEIRREIVARISFGLTNHPVLISFTTSH